MNLLSFFFKTALLMSLSISIFSEDDNKAKDEDKEELKTFLEELAPYPGPVSYTHLTLPTRLMV